VPFDSLVSSPGRLRILAALASESSQPFVALRRATGLTDGNLATHARRLQSAGLVAIQKTIESGKPLTRLELTRAGREALAEHARVCAEALEVRDAASADRGAFSDTADADDDWVD